MKRFLLFGGSDYYAAGGCADLLGTGDNVDELKAKLKPKMAAPGAEIEWWHILDIETGVMVDGSAWQAYGAPDWKFPWSVLPADYDELPPTLFGLPVVVSDSVPSLKDGDVEFQAKVDT